MLNFDAKLIKFIISRENRKRVRRNAFGAQNSQNVIVSDWIGKRIFEPRIKKDQEEREPYMNHEYEKARVCRQVDIIRSLLGSEWQPRERNCANMVWPFEEPSAVQPTHFLLSMACCWTYLSFYCNSLSQISPHDLWDSEEQRGEIGGERGRCKERKSIKRIHLKDRSADEMECCNVRFFVCILSPIYHKIEEFYW